MANTQMLSADRFLEFIGKEGGKVGRADLLRRWKNGNMTADHLDRLISETGCMCSKETTGGRHKTWVYAPKAVAP